MTKKKEEKFITIQLLLDVKLVGVRDAFDNKRRIEVEWAANTPKVIADTLLRELPKKATKGLNDWTAEVGSSTCGLVTSLFVTKAPRKRGRR